MRKFGLFVLLVVAVFLPKNLVFADISQNVVDSTTSDSAINSGGWSQTLGTGISGILTEATFPINYVRGDFGNARWGLEILECLDASYTTCPGSSLLSQYMFLPAGDTTLDFTGLNHVFDPTKYYAINVNRVLAPDFSTDRLFQIRGSVADTYPNGSTGAAGLSDIGFTLVGVNNQGIDPVIIIPGILGSAKKYNKWMIDPILHTYDNLIDTLKANGYVEGQNLFTFPYDWRNSNVDTAILLKQKIDEVKGICACNKVDLVAHSMGGLVARSYIQSPAYTHDVDQLIFLGTPHLGAPTNYLSWEGGRIGFDTQSFILESIFSVEAIESGFPNLFEYIRSKPIFSIQELLPTSNYLRDKESGLMRLYSDNYPRNQFLEDLNLASSTLMNSGVQITNVVGDDGSNDTINTIRVISPQTPKWENGYPDGFDGSTPDKGLELGSGDGVVPLESAGYINLNLIATTSKHRALPTNVEDLVFSKLTGSIAKVLIKKPLLERVLHISMHSPADIYVISPDGKKIGKNFQTNGEYEEIGGAFYSGFEGGEEYVTIPNPLDGEYKVEIQGTGVGKYTVEGAYISDATSTDAKFVGQTIPGLITSVSVNVDNSAPQNISVTPTDATPPQISIISPTSRDYLRSEILPITLEFTDTDSGVASSSIMLNSDVVANNSNIDLFFQKLGNQFLIASATDFLNNIATSSVTFRIITTVDSTISDINRVTALGWITDVKTKDSLLRTLNRAVKIENKIEYLEEKLPGKPKIMKKIQRLEKRLDRVLGKEVVKELEKDKKDKKINQQGYNLLLEDIDWLLDN